jgi:hypothetical protein
MLPSADSTNFVRNKRPRALTRFSPDNIVYCTRSDHAVQASFDLELMDFVDAIYREPRLRHLVRQRARFRPLDSPACDERARTQQSADRAHTGGCPGCCQRRRFHIEAPCRT